jgi:hypothetical protein
MIKMNKKIFVCRDENSKNDITLIETSAKKSDIEKSIKEWYDNKNHVNEDYFLIEYIEINLNAKGFYIRTIPFEYINW